MKTKILLLTIVLGTSASPGTVQASAAGLLAIGATNGGVALRWQGPGVLQSVAAVNGSWTDLPPAVAAITFPATNPATFFRVRQPLFTVVDTGQTNCYNNTQVITAPTFGQLFYGQDPQYAGPSAAYTNNGDGTITDLNTGLMWVQARGSQITWTAALAGAATNRTGGYTDWRMPTIKELYSLIQFSGANGTSLTNTAGYIPFINTNYFHSHPIGFYEKAGTLLFFVFTPAVWQG